MMNREKERRRGGYGERWKMIDEKKNTVATCNSELGGRERERELETRVK